MGAREDTQALNSLKLAEVSKFLGIKLPEKGMTRCPLPGHKDDTPSFEVRPQGNRWVCYGCDKKGGAIDLVMVCHGLPFLEAKRWLTEKSSLGNSSGSYMVSRSARQSSHPQAEPSLNCTSVVESPPDHELYGRLLTQAQLRDTGAAYLQARGLSDAILARFAIGQMPGISIVRDLIAAFGFARIEVSGLLTKQSTPDRYWPIFPEGALLFPYFEAKKIAYFQARTMDDIVRGSRWRNLNHRRRRVYNIEILSDTSIRRVAICEGAIDVLSAAQLGCEALGLIGVTAKLSNTEIISLRNKRVDLLLDWDDPGEKRAMTLRKELSRFGVAATRKSAPLNGAKDVNEYLRKGGVRL